MSIDELNDRRVWLLAGSLILFVGSVMWSKWDRTPQIGTDERVFKTVDALFTAMTTRDSKRLERCASALAEHQRDGSLSEASASLLDSIVNEAREGNWENAARRLYAMMMSQRRDGA